MSDRFLIRRYAPDDLDAVYEICLKTGDAGNDATHLYDDPLALGHLYVGPYVTLEPELAFVLEDNAGVCGYGLAALDSESFYARFVDQWLPKVTEAIPKPKADPATWSPTERLYHLMHHPSIELPEALSSYPSHLHLDLLPRAQGQRQGTRMMHALLDALQERGSPGVHLGVHKSNERAIAFYGKHGFEPLKPRPGQHGDSLIMGKRLP